VAAHLADISLRLDQRPIFRTTMDESGRMWVETERVPSRFTVSAPIVENYGKILAHAIQDFPMSEEQRSERSRDRRGAHSTPRA
jgi:hypothetical protein